jgi:glycerol-3-phosphate dehydrogenase
MTTRAYEIAIIGGGTNGAGIARGAAGRGLKVLFAKQYDLGSATSSASSLTVAEVVFLMEREYARSDDDGVQRQPKYGLRMRPKEIGALERWLKARQASAHPTPAAAE